MQEVNLGSFKVKFTIPLSIHTVSVPGMLDLNISSQVFSLVKTFFV